MKHDGILLGFKSTGGGDVTFSLVYSASDSSKQCCAVFHKDHQRQCVNSAHLQIRFVAPAIHH